MRQLVLSYLSALAIGVGAGEVVFEENFEKIKLDKLSAGATLVGKNNEATLTVEDKKDQGKVLKIQVKKSPNTVSLRYPLEHAHLAGKEIRCTFKALFPGTYTPAKETWARPRVYLTAVQEDGKNWYLVPPPPEPEQKDWQTLSGKGTVPAKIKSMMIEIQIPIVTAEAWFDDVVVDLNPGETPAPTAAKSGNVPSRTPDEIADEAPTKTLDDAKINISPHGAKYVLKFLKAGMKGTDPKKVLLVGPGVGTGKEKYIPKSNEHRQFVVGPPAAIAPNLNGVGLMEALPDVLAETKPGYVLLVGIKGRKKVESDDNFDWNDVCHICLRYGAVPILGLADTTEADDAMRALFRTMAVNAAWPAVDLSLDASAELVSSMLKLMDQYVVQLPSAVPGGAPKKPDTVLEE